jgi:hypothetical protein
MQTNRKNDRPKESKRHNSDQDERIYARLTKGFQLLERVRDENPAGASAHLVTPRRQENGSVDSVTESSKDLRDHAFRFEHSACRSSHSVRFGESTWHGLVWSICVVQDLSKLENGLTAELLRCASARLTSSFQAVDCQGGVAF